MIERMFAGIVLAACISMLVRLGLGPRRRHRLDAALRRGWNDVRRLAWGLWHLPAARRDAERARRIADEAIRRARTGDATREGNVIKPKSFRRPPRDKMH